MDTALHYHYDWAATMIELAGSQVPANWDGQPFTATRKKEAGSRKQEKGRKPKGLPRETACLHPSSFILQHDLASARPDLVQHGMSLLAEWYGEMALTSQHDVDPMLTVLREGGPLHTHGMLRNYLTRLRATGRAQHAEPLAQRHPDEL